MALQSSLLIGHKCVAENTTQQNCLTDFINLMDSDFQSKNQNLKLLVVQVLKVTASKFFLLDAFYNQFLIKNMMGGTQPLVIAEIKSWKRWNNIIKQTFSNADLSWRQWQESHRTFFCQVYLFRLEADGWQPAGGYPAGTICDKSLKKRISNCSFWLFRPL